MTLNESATPLNNNLSFVMQIILFVCSKKFLSNLLKQCSDLVDGLGKQLLQLHAQAIATSVCADADSGNWPDIKEFYEVSYLL